MALAENLYVGNGSAVLYSFTFPYLANTDIKVSLDGVDTIAYSLANATTVQFNAAPTSGTKIRIYRVTNADTAKATFYPGSTVRAQDLNANFNQVLYNTQETLERRLDRSGGEMFGNVAFTAGRGLIFEGATDDANETTLLGGDPTADRTLNLPNSSGYLVSTGDVGTVATSMIADSNVTTAKIANSNVTTAKIADQNVTTAKIADSNVTTDKIANLNVTTAKINDLAVTTAKINDLAVTTAKVADGAITSLKIADGTIVTVDLADNSVTTSKIVDANVTASKLSSNSVETAKVVDQAITTDKIADGAVTSSKIADGTIVTGDLANSSVSTNKIIDQSVTTAKVADLNVTTAKLANQSVTNDKIADGTIALAKMADGAVVTNAEVTGATVNDSSVFTTSASDLRYFRQDTSETIFSGDTWSSSDQRIASTAAIDKRIIDLVDDVGGFVPIANETSFPATNPDINNPDGAGTIISIKALSASYTPSSGTVTIANGAGAGNTVTLTGVTSNLPTGFGVLVETTATQHTYSFHRLTPKATEVTTVAGSIAAVQTAATNVVDINNFADLYQIGPNAPTTRYDNTALVAGDLWFDTLSQVIKAWDGDSWGAITPNQSDLNDIAVVANDLSTQSDLGSISDPLLAGQSGGALETCGDSIAQIQTVAGQITPVNRVGTVAGISTHVSTVAGIATDVTTVSGNNSNVSTVAGISGNVTTVAGINSHVSTVAGISGAVTNVSGISSNVTTVSNNNANVTAVAGQITPVNNVATVAGISSSVSTVAGISTNVTTVAGISSNVTAVANNATNINAVASNAANINSAVSNQSNINAVAGNTSNIASVVSNQANITAVALNASNINSAVGNQANINSTVANASNINAVAASIGNVNTVGGSITNVNRYAAEYTISASQPASPTQGRLWFDTVNSVLKYFNGSIFASIAAGISQIQADTNPTLGGHLNANSKNINNVSTIDGADLTIDFGTI